jgi:hypothetical protein
VLRYDQTLEAGQVPAKGFWTIPDLGLPTQKHEASKKNGCMDPHSVSFSPLGCQRTRKFFFLLFYEVALIDDLPGIRIAYLSQQLKRMIS